MLTKNKFAQKYGRVEARLRVPYGQGMWPAFWMLGNDIDGAGWPACGEIDIMEVIGKEPSTAYGTLHGPWGSRTYSIGGTYTLAGARKFADDFHVFAIEWEAAEVRWYVDGSLYKTVKSTDIPAGTKWVFDHPFFVILNVAVGGSWPGNPDPTTVFPQKMTVDYVRVYDRIQ
jgi:beta-glucanase (GH16 family)